MNIQYKPEIKGARDHYYSIPKSAKEEKAAARERGSDLSIQEISCATTLEEVIAAFRAAPWGMPAKECALAKWAELCTTIEDLVEAYDASCRRFSDFCNPVLEKWEALSCIEVHTATTLEEAEEAYFSSPYRALWKTRDYAKMRAFKKWLSLCSTPDQASAVEEKTQARHDPGLRALYRARYDELHLQKYGRPPTYLVLWAGH
jgi:hypothetical protein